MAKREQFRCSTMVEEMWVVGKVEKNTRRGRRLKDTQRKRVQMGGWVLLAPVSPPVDGIKKRKCYLPSLSTSRGIKRIDKNEPRLNINCDNHDQKVFHKF